jgi:hypothetical protein
MAQTIRPEKSSRFLPFQIFFDTLLMKKMLCCDSYEIQTEHHLSSCHGYWLGYFFCGISRRHIG